MKKIYHPNTIFSGSETASELPILLKRFMEDKTLIYVCSDKVCGVPMDSPFEASKLLS